MMAYPNTPNLFQHFLILILILIPNRNAGLSSNILKKKKKTVVSNKFPF